MKTLFIKISLFLLIIGLTVFLFEYFTHKISDASISLLCKNSVLENDIAKESLKILKDKKSSNAFLNSNICGINYHMTIMLFSLVSAGIGLVFGVIGIVLKKRNRKRYR